MFHYSMIDAFVMPTDDNEIRFVCKLFSHSLIETAPGGRHQNNLGCLMLDVWRLISQIFHRRKNRLRLHHHPLPSAKRRIVHHMMFVARPGAQVMNVQVECTIFLSAFHHAFVERRTANFREKRDDIDAHEVANMRSSRGPSSDPVEVTLKLSR